MQKLLTASLSLVIIILSLVIIILPLVIEGTKSAIGPLESSPGFVNKFLVGFFWTIFFPNSKTEMYITEKTNCNWWQEQHLDVILSKLVSYLTHRRNHQFVIFVRIPKACALYSVEEFLRMFLSVLFPYFKS